MLDHSRLKDPRNHTCEKKWISWTAIFVGAFVGIGLSFLLNLLCLGAGLTAFTANTTGVITLAVNGFVALTVSTILSMYMTGWVAGYLGRAHCPRQHLGELYGFTAWSVALVLTILLATHVGQFVSNYNSTFLTPNVSAVKISTNEVDPLLTSQTTLNGFGEVTVNAEKATNLAGATAYVTFFLFFVGALSSAFGGCIGMKGRKKNATEVDCPVCR